MSNNQRVSIKRKRPNPLFQEWLEELHEIAQSKKDSNLEPVMKAALISLSKYPLPLKTGAECAILQGFHKKLCVFFDRRLEALNGNQGIQGPQTSVSDAGESLVVQTMESNDSQRHQYSVNGNYEQVQPSRNESSSNDVYLPSVSNGYSQQSVTTVETKNTNNLINGKEHHSADEINNCNREQVNLPNKNNSSNSVSNLLSSSKSNSQPPENPIIRSKKKTYKPAHRSGGYAILIALLENMQENPNNTFLAKEILIEKAQKHSNESFVWRKPESFYTAWSNMGRLVTKGLIKKNKKKKVEYALTEQGIAIATKLLEESANIPTVNDIIFHSNTVTPNNELSADMETESKASQITGSQTSVGDIPLIEMPAGSFDVILLIDKNETGGVTKKNDPTVAQFNKYPDLLHEYRSLKIGDFTWIARHKVNKDQELVLPYVVERKRMDDLAHSIIDGRFHEQKFRLRRCGLKNVIYMVENYGSNKQMGLSIQTLKQALENTRVQNGFKIHTTDSLSHSARFLAMMTKRITIEYKDHHLKGCNSESKNGLLMTFNYFSKLSLKTKPLTVTETFIKLLLQLKGVSVEKAIAITNVYRTPVALIKAYGDCNDPSEGPMLLANIKHGSSNRNVGPCISKSVYHLFSLK